MAVAIATYVLQYKCHVAVREEAKQEIRLKQDDSVFYQLHAGFCLFFDTRGSDMFSQNISVL
jgi:hypothetical protein